MADPGMFDLQGRIALVTGAGQGVGRGIARTLAAYGAGGVAVNDYFADRAESVAAEIEAEGFRAAPAVFDVTDLEQVRAGVAAAEAALGPIAVLVNNAGNFGPDGYAPDMPLFWETDPARWRRYVDVNLYGVMNCCHAVLPGMVERKYGRLVTIVSDAGRTMEGRSADYAAAKAGAAGFMRSLAADAARFGVTSNSISISTMRPNLPPEELEAFLSSERTAKQLTRYPLRRFGLPEDIAAVALLLASGAGDWITGQTYPVNGGYSVSL
jgi:3-oxoacyl-[acyl-carrier protein] reductase